MSNDRTVTLKLPSEVWEATRIAAGRELINMSQVVRIALLKELRQRGVLPDAA